MRDTYHAWYIWILNAFQFSHKEPQIEWKSFEFYREQ